MHRVVFNADDFGLSDGVCHAIMELLECGAVSNTTIMPAAPGVGDRVRRWRVASLGVAGVHLQLTGGRPLSPASEVASLVNANTGRFLTRDELVAPNPDEVALEWERQILYVAELVGGSPTHIDSHRGVHRLPACVDVYLALALKYNLPARSGSPEVLTKMRSCGVRTAPLLIRDWTGRSLGLDALKIALLTTATSADGGVMEVVTHPAYVDDHLLSVSSMTVEREGDRKALAALARENWLAESGFVRVAYPGL